MFIAVCWYFVLVILIPSSRAQFKIIGLLDESITKAPELLSEVPVAVAQARGLGDFERTTVSSLIKIRFMEDHVNQNEPAQEHVLRITDNLQEDNAQQHRNVVVPISKSYSRAIQPHIRKFAYIEERSFHKNGENQNRLPARKNSINFDYKLKKVTKYRNNYTSKCRCERISNCPKIQITIHRCEQDYFMCCF